MTHQDDHEFEGETLTHEECVLEPQNTPLDLHVVGLETNDFTEDVSRTIVWVEFAKEEHVKDDLGGVIEPTFDEYQSDDVGDDSNELVHNHVEDLVINGSPLVAAPTSQEFSQEDLFGMHVTNKYKMKDTPINGGLIEGKRNKIFKTTSIDDSLVHYRVGDMGGLGFDYQTKLWERDTYEDISLSELGGDLFNESRLHEYDEHFPFEPNNQPLSTLDPSVMAPGDDKEPVWDEFPFDPDDEMELDEDSISANNGDVTLDLGIAFSFDQSDNEVGAGLKVYKAPDSEGFDGVLEHKSDILVHIADHHLGVEQCYHVDDVGGRFGEVAFTVIALLDTLGRCVVEFDRELSRLYFLLPRLVIDSGIVDIDYSELYGHEMLHDIDFSPSRFFNLSIMDDNILELQGR
ncbi:hypothetical protein SUGI_1017220 [Cryptomeria japonica]|nr:hypothetical protein SUGI_1017220 [Cryptomeria japonica]